MVRVAVNAHRLTGLQAGVARYLGSLLACWAEERPPGIDAFELHTPRPLPDGAPRAPWIEPRLSASALPPLLWENLVLPRRIRACDVLLAPSYTLPLRGRRRPAVLVLFDALHAVRPDDFGWRGRAILLPLVRASARRAEIVFTISRTSRDDIVREFGLPPERVRIAVPGPDPRFRPLPESDRSLLRGRAGIGREPYLLFVGKFSRRRNVPLLIRAAGEIARRGHPHRLVLAGYNHLDLPLDRLAAEAGARLTYLEAVPDDLLAGLYNEADVFIQAAEFEPFSLPLLEAMACGTPVVTVANSGMLEIGGDAVRYIDRPDAGHLADAVCALLEDPALRARVGAAGRRRAAEFSWEEPARQVSAALVELARGHRA